MLYYGVIQSVGDIYVVVYSTIQAAYFLGIATPDLMALLNARVAAATIYQTIDRVSGHEHDIYLLLNLQVSKINADSLSGQQPTNVLGRVSFKDVRFHYP